MSAVTDMRTRFVETASQLLDEDPRTAVVLADISDDRFERAAGEHPERVINVGIRESLMVSVAGGLALSGMRPIAHSYAPFLVDRSYEHVKLDLTHQEAPAVLVSVGASYDTSQGGRTHHGPADVALIDTLPGWTVHVPGHPDEVPSMLQRAVGADGSAYLRLTTATNAAARASSGDGRLDVVRRGSGALVLAVGPMLDPVLEATADLDVTVAYSTTVRPLDLAGVRRLATSDLVVLVEPYLAGTSSWLVDEALRDRPHRTLGLGVGRGDVRAYGTPEHHAALHGIDPPGLRRSLYSFLVSDQEPTPS